MNFYVNTMKLLMISKLRLYGKNIHNRVKSKIFEASLYMSNYIHGLIFNRSVETIMNFLHGANEIITLQTTVINSIVSIKKIQEYWRGIMMLNNIRLSILCKKWDEITIKLINQHKTKIKRKNSILKNLKWISDITKTKVLKNYLNLQKIKYNRQILRFIRNRKIDSINFEV